jgi:hypothetical protein
MPELTDSVPDESNSSQNSNTQEDIDLGELAEEIVRLLIRELKIENDRTGNH